MDPTHDPHLSPPTCLSCYKPPTPDHPWFRLTLGSLSLSCMIVPTLHRPATKVVEITVAEDGASLAAAGGWMDVGADASDCLVRGT